MFDYLLDRFKEPSSWAGLAPILVVFGLPPGVVDLGVQLAVVVVGGVAFFRKERARPKLVN